MIAATSKRTSRLLCLTLALLMSIGAHAASSQSGNPALTAQAVAFVHTLAKEDFKTAESDFTDEMRKAAPPPALQGLWQKLVGQFGPYGGTGRTRILVTEGYTTVIVRTQFEHRAVGLAVSFDAVQKIAGLHLSAAP